MFFLLLAAQLLADFPFQTGKIFELKMNGIRGGILHAVVFIVLSLIISAPYLSSAKVWVAIFLIGLTHLIVDEGKIRLYKRFNVDNLWIFLFDQAIHIFIIWLFANKVLVVEVNWTFKIVMLIISGYIVATFTGVFLIHYLKLMLVGDYKGEDLTRPQLHGLIERAIIFTLIILPGSWYIFIPAVLLIRIIISLKQDLPTTHLDIALSTGVATIAGIILHNMMY